MNSNFIIYVDVVNWDATVEVRDAETGRHVYGQIPAKFGHDMGDIADSVGEMVSHLIKELR